MRTCLIRPPAFFLSLVLKSYSSSSGFSSRQGEAPGWFFRFGFRFQLRGSKVSVLLTARWAASPDLVALVADRPRTGGEFRDSLDRKIGQPREHRTEVFADR